MAGVRISAGNVARTALRGPAPQVIANTVRITQDIAGRVTLAGPRPYAVVINGEYERDDFRYPPRNYLPTDPLPGALRRRWYIPETLSTWYLNSTRVIETAVLNRLFSRDVERFTVPVPEFRSDDDAWFRRFAASIGERNYRAYSLDEHDPNDGNVDVKARFRIWAPRNSAGFYDTLSNRMMLIVHGGGEGGEVLGYALRDNFGRTPQAFELVKFIGIPEDQELEVGTTSRRSAFVHDSYKTIFSRNSSGQLTLKTLGPTERGKIPKPRRLRKRLRAAGIQNTAYPRGDATVLEIPSGLGESLDGTTSIRLVDIPGRVTQDVTRVEPQWFWTRVQARSLANGTVTIKAKIWGGAESDEPAAWQMEAVDSGSLSLGSGWSGFGVAPAVNAQAGLEAGIIKDNGDVDVDSFQVQTWRPPLGTSVSIPSPTAECLLEGIKPNFVVPNGRYVSTIFDTTPLNSLPVNWFVPRTANGPIVQTERFGTVGQEIPGDDPRRFRVKTDLELEPAKYPYDLGTVSTEHTFAGDGIYITTDTNAEGEADTKILDPYMVRDFLAWSEPWPGSTQFAHDGQVDDAEILLKFRADTKANSLSVWLRSTGLKGYENGYVITCISEQDEGVWQIQKYVDGESGELTTFRAPWLTGEWFRMRIRITGASDRSAGNRQSVQYRYLDPYTLDPQLSRGRGGVRIQASVWLEGFTEPLQPQVDFLDKGVNHGFTNGGYSGLPSWASLSLRRANAANYPGATGVPGEFGSDGPRYVRIHDRGYVGWGSAGIGSRQHVAEFHVHSLATPIRNFPALDKRNRASLALALSMSADQWTPLNANTEVTTTTALVGPDQTSVRMRALELAPFGLQGDDRLAWAAMVESVERLDVTAMSRISVLMTTQHLGTSQTKDTPGLIDDYNWNQDKVPAVGVRFYAADGSLVQQSIYSGDEIPVVERVAPDGRAIRAIGGSFSTPPGAVSAAAVLVGYGNSKRNVPEGLAQPPKGEMWAYGKVGLFQSDDLARYYDTHPGEWVAPTTPYMPDNTFEALEPAVRVMATVEAPVATATFSLPMPTHTATKPQFLRPAQDLLREGWTRHDGATTGLYQAIDEPQPVDADFIQSAHRAAADDFSARLNTVVNPDPDQSGYFVHYRYRRRGSGTAALRVALLQGTTEIASWVDADLSKQYVTAKQPLTPAQIAAITDYQDLRVVLVGDVTTT